MATLLTPGPVERTLARDDPEARVREICATVKGMHDQIDALSEDFRGMEEPDLSHEPPTDPYVPIPWGTRFFRRSDIERGPTPLPTDAADAAERLQSRRRRLRR